MSGKRSKRSSTSSDLTGITRQNALLNASDIKFIDENCEDESPEKMKFFFKEPILNDQVNLSFSSQILSHSLSTIGNESGSDDMEVNKVISRVNSKKVKELSRQASVKNRKILSFNVSKSDSSASSTSGNLEQINAAKTKDSLLPIVDILEKMKKNASPPSEEYNLKFNNLRNKKANKISKRKFILEHFCSLKKLKEYIISMRSNLFYFLERPVGLIGLLYRLFTFTIIIGSIVTGALTTFKKMDKWSLNLLYWYEVFATTYFCSEFVLRLWSSCHRVNYRGFYGYIKFLRRPLILIELSVIVISISVLTFGTIVPQISSKKRSYDHLFNPNALLLLRFFQILRFFYIDRHAETWILVMKTVQKHRFELITSVYIGTILMLFSSFLILIFEKPVSEENGDDMFRTFADAMYWSIITMTSIGYGDKSPRTFIGKIISTTLCIFGLAFWTLPGGIIGSGFALKVEQKNKKKQFNRLVPAAASLIQAWWRMKATLYLSSSNVPPLLATVYTFDTSKHIFSRKLRGIQTNMDKILMNNYFNGIDAPRIRKQGEDNEKKDQNKTFPKIITSPLRKSRSFISTKSFYGAQYSFKHGFSTQNSKTESNPAELSNAYSSILHNLSPEHLILIRMILLLKFFVARTHFKLAFKPYDFKDVIEQYTQGNMDILLKMKDLQRKIENVATALPHISRMSYSNLDYPIQRQASDQSSLNHNFDESLHEVDMMNVNSLHKLNKRSFHDASYENLQSKRVTQIKNSNKRRNSMTLSEKNEIENYVLNERISNLETNLENLASKLDILIDLSKDKIYNSK